MYKSYESQSEKAGKCCSIYIVFIVGNIVLAKLSALILKED